MTATRTAPAQVKPVTKRWHEGYANQAVYQTPGFYTVHDDCHFNHIWLGTDPEEAHALLEDINHCMRLAQGDRS